MNTSIAIFKGIGGGAAIAIGAKLYLLNPGITGAFLFSIGLCAILVCNFKLFTGSIGYVYSVESFLESIDIFIGNIIGSGLLCLYNKESFIDIADKIMKAKLSASLNDLFLNSIICGILVYTAVEAFKQKKEIITILAVMAFILAGGEHCIADICYSYASSYSITVTIPRILLVTIGNSFGAIFSQRLKAIKYK